MAQLVEQRIRNAWVGGSSPPIGSYIDYPCFIFSHSEDNIFIVT